MRWKMQPRVCGQDGYGEEAAKRLISGSEGEDVSEKMLSSPVMLCVLGLKVQGVFWGLGTEYFSCFWKMH